VKRVRFDRLMASSALGLALMFMSQPGHAQMTDQQIQAAVPTPDIPDLPPPTAKDVGGVATGSTTAAKGADAVPATDAAKEATKDTTPAADTAKEETKDVAPAADATKEATKDTTPAADTAKEETKDVAPAADTTKEATKNVAPGADTAKEATKHIAPAANTAKEATKDVTPAADAAKKEVTKDVTPAADAAKKEATKDVTPAADAAKEVTKDKAATPGADTEKAAATPAPTPVAVNPDIAISDQLRELIGHRLDRFVDRKPDRAGVEAYYREHNYQPLWITDGVANERAKAAIAYLAQVETDGLNPSDYPTPDFAAAKGATALADAELQLTNSVLTYARHAQIGQINFTRVGPDIQFNVVAPEPAEVLAKLDRAKDVTAALDSYNPPQQGFKALKAKLAELRAGGSAGAKPAEENKASRVHIPEGKILRPGMKDPRVILLRKRLDIAGDKNNPLYDDAVRDAVKTFQTEADIGVDGNVGANTTRALNGQKQEARRPKANVIDTIVANMDRWRWLPRKLGNSEQTYVMVNVPDYTLSLFHDGKVYWKTKIVVGKPSKATPMTTAEMKYITVNPTWNVPPSIIENEYLPALEADPEALDRIGLKIRQDPDGTIHIYQPPGAGNALGRIRFNFPNKFLVYQHDTPDKYLFARAKRAYSHGCMRVQDPLEYATKLLSIELPKEHYTPKRIESMYGDNEINIDFPKPIPVHLTYQTAFVDQDGKLQLRDDVYGRDAKMIAILKSKSERRVADIAIERRPDPSSRPVRMPVGMYGGDTTTSYGGGPSFFGWLFGGGQQQPQQPQAYRPRGYIGPAAGNSGHYSNNNGFWTRR
jgi:L,D-transpeptidase YcbB